MAIRRRRSRIGVFLALLALGVAALRGRVRRFEIVESSMEPTLRAGDYVVATRRRPGIRRGEIVVFEARGRAGFDVIKRVIALPGETVEIANGQVHVDGAVLAEPWADGPTYPEGRWEVGRDHIFVLGDRRSASSMDGRSIGPLAFGAVPWRVGWRYWPLDRIGRL